MLVGNDQGQITIGGTSALYSSLELSIETARDAQFAIFNASAVGIGTAPNRNVKLTLKAYRKSLALDTLLASDAPLVVEFSIGGTGKGYKFTMPAMVAPSLKDEISGSAGLISIELMAQNDATGVDLKVTRL